LDEPPAESAGSYDLKRTYRSSARVTWRALKREIQESLDTTFIAMVPKAGRLSVKQSPGAGAVLPGRIRTGRTLLDEVQSIARVTGDTHGR
jgi:hypothetical protein